MSYRCWTERHYHENASSENLGCSTQTSTSMGHERSLAYSYRGRTPWCSDAQIALPDWQRYAMVGCPSMPVWLRRSHSVKPVGQRFAKLEAVHRPRWATNAGTFGLAN